MLWLLVFLLYQISVGVVSSYELVIFIYFVVLSLENYLRIAVLLQIIIFKCFHVLVYDLVAESIKHFMLLFGHFYERFVFW